MAKPVEMDYKKLSIAKMLNWLEDNKKSQAELKAFSDVALVEEDGELKEKPSLAKKYFYEEYKGEITFLNAPQAKVKKLSTIERLKKYRNL